MKQITLFLLCLFFIGAHLQAQDKHNPKTTSFKKMAREQRAQYLKEYPRVANVEFKCCKTAAERHKKVDQAWHDLWDNFTEYYHEKGLFFKRKRRVYVHLHFSETGHLDHFGYHFKGKENETTKRFVSLFKEYIKDHNFAIAEGVKFSESGELHLLPQKGIKEGL